MRKRMNDGMQEQKVQKKTPEMIAVFQVGSKMNPGSGKVEENWTSLLVGVSHTTSVSQKNKHICFVTKILTGFCVLCSFSILRESTHKSIFGQLTDGMPKM